MGCSWEPLVILSAVYAFMNAGLFGLYSMIFGVSGIVTGIEARNAGKRLHSVMADAA